MTNPNKAFYNVIGGDIREYKAGTKRAGEKYAYITMVPVKRVRGNLDEKHSVISDIAYDVEQLPLFLKALEEGKPTNAWDGIFVNIPCELCLVQNLPPFRMQVPNEPGKYSKNVRTAMSILMFLSNTDQLKESPEDAVRRIIERSGKWETGAPALAVAMPETEEKPSELPAGYRPHASLPGVYLNEETGDMKTAQQLGLG